VIMLLCSVLAGGLLAKRVFENAYKWELQAREDSLAYDIAYTSTTSEIGYGSFVSDWTGSSIDKFDV
jgi:hypothetical protein